MSDSQIRVIIDRGESIKCPLCSIKLGAGYGHLCRKSMDGTISGQTWKLNGGEQIRPLAHKPNPEEPVQKLESQ